MKPISIILREHWILAVLTAAAIAAAVQLGTLIGARPLLLTLAGLGVLAIVALSIPSSFSRWKTWTLCAGLAFLLMLRLFSPTESHSAWIGGTILALATGVIWFPRLLKRPDWLTLPSSIEVVALSGNGHASILPIAPLPGAGENNLLADELTEEDFDEAAEGEIVQRWTRSQNAEGERLEGIVKVTFEPGVGQAYVHLPIAPSFSSLPTGWAECDGDEEFVAEFDALHRYGARLMIRRPARSQFAACAEVAIVLTSARVAARAA